MRRNITLASKPQRQGRMNAFAHPRRSAERHYRTVFISDTHLGTRGCRSEFLADFLRRVSCERLYLVGAGTHPGAGVPGVISSARVLDMVVPDVSALR